MRLFLSAFRRCGCGGFFSRLFLLLADQCLVDSHFGQAERALADGKAVFFDQLSNPLRTFQHVAGSSKAKSGPEGLVN